MAKQQTLEAANISYEEMKSSILKIERRITDLNEFDPNSVNKRNDPKIRVLKDKLDKLLVSIFGINTVEYDRYCRSIIHLDTASSNFMQETPIEEVRDGLCYGIERAREQLVAIKSGFIEELEDAGQTNAGKTLKAYEGLELNTVIERASGQLFRDGYYANAIEDSVKALNAFVRLNSGVEDKDGVSLMEYVFNPSHPILKFNDLVDSFDKDEQRGFMMMLCGAVTGLRNPRAHKIIIDNPEMALEFIAYISMLASLVDKAKK